MTVLSLICLFLLLVTASVLSPTMISCISTMGPTAALIWLAVSKTVNFLRRLRALQTSCTWRFAVMALWATQAFIWNIKVLWRPTQVGFCMHCHKICLCVAAGDLVGNIENLIRKQHLWSMLLLTTIFPILMPALRIAFGSPLFISTMFTMLLFNNTFYSSLYITIYAYLCLIRNPSCFRRFYSSKSFPLSIGSKTAGSVLWSREYDEWH